MKLKNINSCSSLMKVSVFIGLVGIITLGCASFTASNTQQPTSDKSRSNINTASKDVPTNKSENQSTTNTLNQNVQVSNVNSPNVVEEVDFKQDTADKIAQQPTLETGTYNLGSRYIVIATQGNRTCYQGISVPNGRYAVAVGETTGSISLAEQNEGFVIDGWKQYGRNITLHQHGRKLLITLNDEPLGEYDYFKAGSLGEQYSDSLKRCLNSKDVFFETAPGYRINPKSSSTNKIADGFYALGGTGQGLEVKGEQYRYYDEEGQKYWRPISELKYVQEGVVFADQNYWCLSTLAPKNRPGICTANGWNPIN